jgi:probable rRNA maturation factor
VSDKSRLQLDDNAAEMIAVVKAVPAPVSPARIRSMLGSAAAVPEVAARLPDAGWDVALRISGDRELRRLNRRFLGKDQATDVLSFPSGDKGPGAHLGDIVISWPVVIRQAAEFGHPAESELALLAIHGFLHLLGWDHATRTDEVEMNRLTLAALDRSGTAVASARLLTAPPAG